MTTTSPCFVCSDALTPTSFATCDQCTNDYHLNQRSDMEGKDCGQVWINETHLGLEFACNRCLEPAEAPLSLDDILDLDEAALAAGIGLSDLEAAAAAGLVRHRKTGRGVYLFERRDVVAFVAGGRG